MDMTTRIWYHKEKGLSDNLIELETIKEYLMAQINTMLKEIYKEEEDAEKKGIPLHLIVIFISVLKERKEVLEHLLKDIIVKVNEEKKMCKY